MKLDGAMLEDVPDIMKAITEATEYTVKYLGASVVPEKNDKTNAKLSFFSNSIARLFSKAESTTQLTLFSYALDKNKVISAKDFVK